MCRENQDERGLAVGRSDVDPKYKAKTKRF